MTALAGRVAIVTGAARHRGIGRATALRLARAGAMVAVSGLPRDPLFLPDHEKELGWTGTASLADEIRQFGGQSIAVDCDVTDPHAVEKMVSRAHDAFGRIDILVNNAGVASDAGAAPLISLDHALWQRTLDVNVSGVFYVAQAAGRVMAERGEGGAIINLSSMAGRVGMANFGAYCASKFAVIGLTQQLALELAANDIRVNCIAPGSIDTDMMDGTFNRTAGKAGIEFDRMKQGVARGVPLGRQGRVDEIASTVEFLAGASASYITGQTINVNGGTRLD